MIYKISKSWANGRKPHLRNRENDLQSFIRVRNLSLPILIASAERIRNLFALGRSNARTNLSMLVKLLLKGSFHIRKSSS